MLNYNFLEKGLELVSPQHFVHDFSRKMFLMLQSINWPNFIVWLPLLLDIVGNMCITMFVNQAVTSYLENGKSFWGEIKNIFHQL